MSLFRKGLHIAGRQVVIIAGVLAALLLLLIGSGAWLSTAVAERKDEIANWAGERTGYQIEIGEAGLYWLDFFPKLMLSDVSVLTPRSQRPVLAFDSLFIGVDLIKSLNQQQPIIDTANISGLRLSVIRDANGQFSVRDLNWQSDDKTTDGQWQAVLAGLEQLGLQEIALDYQDALLPSLSGHYQLHQANLTQSGKWLSADINLTLPQHLGQQLMLNGELLRDGEAWPEWDVVINGSQIQLAALLQAQQLRGVSIDQGRGDLRVTASKQADKITANGLIRLQSSRFVRAEKASDDASPPPLMVDYFDSEFAWMQQGGRWQLDLQAVDLAVNGEAWPQSQLRASFDPQTGTQLKSNYFRLSDVSAAAALIDDAPDLLKIYAPAGDVSNLQLKLDKNQNIKQLQATVQELGFQENGDIPGMSGLSFIVDWTDEQIDAQINSQDLALYAKNWLPETLYF
ncbi:MAG: hypothetical protein WD177_00005, partial [Methylophaga sp.]